MGEATSDEGNAHMHFFFNTLVDIKQSYPIIFSGRGSSKPKCKEYRDFKEKWGFISVVYSFAEKKIEEIEKINASYLNDFFQLLSYTIEEQEADEAQDKFDEQRRKAMKGR